jgi:hypothetical protein
MSECKAYRREIDEAADGGHVSTSAHASSCRACGDELRERERLRALVGGLGKVEAPADFEFRLRARMATAKGNGGGGRFGGARWLYGFAPVAIAACFVVVSATLYFRQAARPADAPRAAAESASVGGAVQTPPGIKQDDANRSNVPVGKVVEGVPAAVASPASHKAGARFGRVTEVASKVEGRDKALRNTVVNSVEAARVLRPIAVKASAEPLRVILRDARGATRVVPMRSVSFGSQDFLARETALRPSAAAEVGGVW